MDLIITVPDLFCLTGQLVQVRYRCRNEIGWSEFSDHDYFLKAGVPIPPPTPLFIEADSTSVTISILETHNINGGKIVAYKIWRDDGNNINPTTTLATGYDGHSPIFKGTGLTPGLLYKFSVSVVNSEGES